MPTVLIAGGTGLIGKRLTTLLKAKGHKVILLSRTPDLQADPPEYAWDTKKMHIAPEAVKQADYVINLAGAGIADQRWTDSRKQVIIESRVKTAQLLWEGFRQMNKQPKAYISASAIGYYGDRGDELLKETSAPGPEGFLPESCIAWEGAVQPFVESDIRTVIIRIGIVMSTQGGALAKMLPSYYVRTGAYFGDGQQYYSWIHIDDLCGIFIKAIEDEKMKGTYNGVAPNPLRNKQLAKDIATALDKPSLIVPAPTFGLRLAMGEMADVVLDGSKVSSEKIESTGFQFQFPDFIPAIRDLKKRGI
ncbi:MAG: TIGR01777 family oxidoreductase [Bacteroidota bacterium]